jgi:hypothetical protein
VPTIWIKSFVPILSMNIVFSRVALRIDAIGVDWIEVCNRLVTNRVLPISMDERNRSRYTIKSGRFETGASRLTLHFVWTVGSALSTDVVSYYLVCAEGPITCPNDISVLQMQRMRQQSCSLTRKEDNPSSSED